MNLLKALQIDQAVGVWTRGFIRWQDTNQTKQPRESAGNFDTSIFLILRWFPVSVVLEAAFGHNLFSGNQEQPRFRQMYSAQFSTQKRIFSTFFLYRTFFINKALKQKTMKMTMPVVWAKPHRGFSVWCPKLLSKLIVSGKTIPSPNQESDQHTSLGTHFLMALKARK